MRDPVPAVPISLKHIALVGAGWLVSLFVAMNVLVDTFREPSWPSSTNPIASGLEAMVAIPGQVFAPLFWLGWLAVPLGLTWAFLPDAKKRSLPIMTAVWLTGFLCFLVGVSGTRTGRLCFAAGIVAICIEGVRLVSTISVRVVTSRSAADAT
jgi:hypothetical protein